eukprot:CAMPEP_0170519062 /NCGR_PEP_ID=MMETSP0209-20121228/4607_1 /TAXON_ID=665100 ORGANISM="Litonotus pictus, Strain P1" /NCGR_SAMPLE_ID=MMETSP0209 /ASSEMBLY_ACC=CAM_ASM_000301 /LENGTH=49 /DNA_ID=CAMNT_0010804853 /DNA_START=461 /DNA_END=610 /DNA_ORIENTATION=-
MTAVAGGAKDRTPDINPKVNPTGAVGSFGYQSNSNNYGSGNSGGNGSTS